MITRLYHWLGAKINGISFTIDIINACPLSCPSCAYGVLGKRDGKVMSIDKFRAILDKAQRECKVRKVQLYMTSDPLLHPNLHHFVSECTQRKIPCLLSTTLQQVNCNLPAVIEARPAKFRISFSGWERSHIYQRGFNVVKFLVNLEKTRDLPKYPETEWQMFWHEYKDNAHEEKQAEQLACDYGFKFIKLPAIYMISERLVEGNFKEEDYDTMELLPEDPFKKIAHLKVDHNYCLLQHKQITIDANGMVYLCELVYEDRFKLVNFLEAPLKDIQKRIRAHPFCKKCMAVGNHTYQYCYDDSAKDDPVGKAQKEHSKSYPHGR